MGGSTVKLAKLDDERLERLHRLEEELGVWVVALEPSACRLADLSEEDLERLKGGEDELGVILLAYEKS